METASADIAHVSWLNAREVMERGGLPSDPMHSGWIHKGNPSNAPQGIATIKLRHSPEAGRLQVWIENLTKLTCCIFPNMMVEGA